MSDKNIFEENVVIPDMVNAKVDQTLSDLPDHGTIREVIPANEKKKKKKRSPERPLPACWPLPLPHPSFFYLLPCIVSSNPVRRKYQ